MLWRGWIITRKSWRALGSQRRWRRLLPRTHFMLPSEVSSLKRPVSEILAAGFLMNGFLLSPLLWNWQQFAKKSNRLYIILCWFWCSHGIVISAICQTLITIFCILQLYSLCSPYYLYCSAKLMFLRVFMAGNRHLLTPSVACKVKLLFDDAVSRFVMFFYIKGAQAWDIRSLGFSWFLQNKVWAGDLVVKILTYNLNFWGSYAAFSFWLAYWAYA